MAFVSISIQVKALTISPDPHESKKKAWPSAINYAASPFQEKTIVKLTNLYVAE